MFFVEYYITYAYDGIYRGYLDTVDRYRVLSNKVTNISSFYELVSTRKLFVSNLISVGSAAVDSKVSEVRLPAGSELERYLLTLSFDRRSVKKVRSSRHNF